jgi:hypothetical protein
VKILGREYTITYVSPSPLNTAYMGLCDNSRQLIYIEDYQTQVEEADTVLHEVIHAIRNMARLDIPADLEEQMVATTATGLISVFHDNPEFAQWVTARRDS